MINVEMDRHARDDKGGMKYTGKDLVLSNRSSPTPRHCEESYRRRNSPDSYVDVCMSDGSPRHARDDRETVVR